VTITNQDMNTPLHYFCEKFASPNCQEAFNLFMTKGAQVNARNTHGETPLHKAMLNSTVRLLISELLLQAGADVNIQSSKGQTPLTYAIHKNREDLVALLLKNKADIRIRDPSGKTPLQLARENRKHDGIVKRIMKVEGISISISLKCFRSHRLAQYLRYAAICATFYQRRAL
jgi:ankyrin repeat protein